jgi:malonate-semialdehyde dehydrogenase (acetylating) / methylmalonate-semialdehyde dehydrogenase
MWMFPIAIACGNAFVLKPSERDPVGGAAAGRPQGAGACPTACSTSCRATRRRSMRCSRTRTCRRSASSAPRRSRSTSTRPARARQARAGARRREEPHGGDARRRSRAGGRRADRRRPTARPASAAWRSVVRGGRGRVADALVARLAERARALKIGDGMDGKPRWGRSSPRSTFAKVTGYVDTGVAEGAASWSTAAGSRCRAARTASSSAAACSTRCSRSCASTRKRSSARCSRVVRVPDFEAAVALVNAHEFGNGVAHLHRATATPRASSRAA